MSIKLRAVIVAIIANLALIGCKFFIAFISGSLALTASAWHSVSDLIPSTLVLASLGLAAKMKKSSSRRTGIIEHGTAALVAGFIFIIAIELVRDSFTSETKNLEYIGLAIAVSGISIAITYFMARYQILIGRENDSPSITANGLHARADMYSSVAVMFALIASLMGFSAFDKIAAVFIAIMISVNGIEVLTDALRAILRGEEPDPNRDSSALVSLLGKARRFAPAFFLVAAIAYFASGVFTVRWDEIAIVKRFGKPVRQVSAGLQYRLPRPFEREDKVNVSSVQTETVPSSLVLSGDSNLIEIEAVVHYQVSDPFAFRYAASDPRVIVQDAAKSALRDFTNKNAVDFILTEGKQRIQEEALAVTQRQIDELGIGVKVLALQLTRDIPPPDVLESFRDVASAREDKNTYINEALAYQAEQLPKSRGEAQKALEEATAYREGKIRSASGEATRFLLKAKAYRASPSVTEKRLYIEAMEKSLASIEKIIVDGRVKVETTDLWLRTDADTTSAKEIRKP